MFIKIPFSYNYLKDKVETCKVRVVDTEDEQTFCIPDNATSVMIIFDKDSIISVISNTYENEAVFKHTMTLPDTFIRMIPEHKETSGR